MQSEEIAVFKWRLRAAPKLGIGTRSSSVRSIACVPPAVRPQHLGRGVIVHPTEPLKGISFCPLRRSGLRQGWADNRLHHWVEHRIFYAFFTSHRSQASRYDTCCLTAFEMSTYPSYTVRIEADVLLHH